MKTAEHTEVLDREGTLLADAAVAAGLDAPVPTCPDWRVRDLLRHTGTVHRWATRFVAEALPEFQPWQERLDLDGDALLDWFREGHGHLVAALRDAPVDLECWTFLPAPSPLAFWARRQANETAVHRIDAESARGGTLSALDARFAADGIDELLRGFHAREKSRMRTAEPRVLRVRTTDTEGTWTVRLSVDVAVTERGETAPADCEVSGPAADLYLALWNRRTFPAVSGDAELAALWREKAGV
ncbi:maleylpyruvate isomerase family mycothiol-dependent enzyme [Streptomyces flavofungini]|uniref:maleylpyruvate isomerase family mycothiol-dependent enzyme n=1 Tax=Streptomyces flavofungini TaxID=68200 RepID=UPI0025B02794|nr:maleylpyruvate isomerase family mycothiol-dependent enzyme [Streptomyces flavofungini]WJV50468.1 maleylpyruvate isomerase family mycothiol-dependent enzyme [Streptomyces flavofungini]